MNLLAALLMVQAAAAQTFEVAAIKPGTAELGSSSGVTSETGRISARNVTLKHCIRSAYDIPEARILGGPKWIDEDRYDIDAKAPGPAGDHEMMLMLRSLLTDRFQLAFHRETRTLPGYALVVGKRGLTAKRSAPGSASRSNSTRRTIDAAGCNMDCMARKLSEVLHLPVANLTAIEGEFDFSLAFTPVDLQATVPPGGDAPGTSIFAAVEEQLGLKLEARKVPTEVLVIDHAEKASPN